MHGWITSITFSAPDSGSPANSPANNPANNPANSSANSPANNPANSSKNNVIIGCDGMLYHFDGQEVALPEDTTLSPGSVPYVSFVPVTEDGAYTASEVRLEAEEIPEPVRTLQKEVSQRLSPKRYMHSFRVSKIARVFAEKAGCSPDKAEIAGLLHDIAKENSNEENAGIILEHGWTITDFELTYHHILHAVAGAIIAKEEFGIDDREILDSIRCHNGRPSMSDMEKVIYVSDHIEKVNKQGGEANKLLTLPSVDDAIYRIILLINRFYARQHKTPDVITECTMNYMLRSIGRERDDGISPDTRSVITDDVFDKALIINTRQTVGMKSVPNSRQLGGYVAFDGRKVRKNCIVRSSRLKHLTAEDASQLMKLGLNTIIDLRMPEEAAADPDINTEGFRFFDCPLSSVEISDYQNKVKDKFITATDPKERSFYLFEYLSCIKMEDMYINVLTSEGSVRSLRRVFEILTDPDTEGILFHCTSGKDRTGIVAALILHVLGVGIEDIRLDYYASAVATFAATEAMAQNLRKEHYSEDAIDEVRYFNGIGQYIAEGAYKRITEEYGSVDKYLSDVIGLTAFNIDRLREKYLE